MKSSIAVSFQSVLGLGLLTLALSYLMTGCGAPEELKISPRNSPPMLVIRGLIDDRPGADTITISYTTNWSEGVKRVEDGAQVNLAWTEGVNYPAGSIALSPIGNGMYVTPTGFLGQENGPIYSMRVTLNGKVYTASSIMPRLYRPAIDSFQVIERRGEGFFRDGYYVKAYARVFNDANSFYFYKFYRNDSLLNLPDSTNPNPRIFVSDNSQINQAINGLEIPFVYKKNDRVKVEIYSITREAYNFYQDAINQIFTDGGMFGTPPANVKGNITGGALGFFQVSGYFSDTTTIR